MEGAELPAAPGMEPPILPTDQAESPPPQVAQEPDLTGLSLQALKGGRYHFVSQDVISEIPRETYDDSLLATHNFKIRNSDIFLALGSTGVASTETEEDPIEWGDSS